MSSEKCIVSILCIMFVYNYHHVYFHNCLCGKVKHGGGGEKVSGGHFLYFLYFSIYEIIYYCLYCIIICIIIVCVEK